ncbi:MAG: 3D-(3,5/4)-trihydroxycyclohexane-1,2-dione acylhydrolase (decyclizing) [Oceanospirillaceae bacterium]|jgi:3D-(3,5/4)-trihydroxycyclohexane-1,2-dione acylhydrolase (decyclizing)
MKTIKLTMSQALVKFLIAQKTIVNGEVQPMFAAMFAIFGHGNVAGMGEALYQVKDQLPTLRAHNEQGMTHAAIAYAKAKNRQQMMACTTSIGPGAANMITAAALAHANRLPVLLLPGDTFASRTPDPVLQQLENFGDPTISTNDCFRPVSRYFDRITRPEQIINSLPVAMQTLLDPEFCGPVTIALCQDVQAQAYDYPVSFFAEKVHYQRRQNADNAELQRAIELLRKAKQPLLIAGGGVHYSGAVEQLLNFAQATGIPVAETQAGKGAMRWDHPNYVGAIGVTGSNAANLMAEKADLVIAVGSRLQDFTTASRTLFEREDTPLIQLNIARFDSIKHNSVPLLVDAKVGLTSLQNALSDWQVSSEWQQQGQAAIAKWNQYYQDVTSAQIQQTPTALPTDAQVLGAVKRNSVAQDVIVCAAGGLPGELHKLWRTDHAKAYHVEYGYSCMGYEIAGGLGVKMATPDSDVIVVVGDGSYMMLNSELATSVMLGYKVIVVVLDNRGYGCINRLQQGTGGAAFNNLLENCQAIDGGAPKIDFAAHGASMGALSEKVANIAELEQAMLRAKAADRSYLITLDTDPSVTSEGGCWWDVAVAEVSARDETNTAHQGYISGKQQQPY